MKITLDPNQLPTVTFSCGPSQGLSSVRETPLYKTLFERSHRATDISTNGLYKQITDHLRQLLGLPQDYTIIFFPGGATAALDAVTWNLTKDSVSGLAFGAFSHLWNEKLAARLGPSVRRAVRIPEEGSFFPKEKPDYHASLVLLTPNETSTGVQIPNDYLEEAWDLRGKDTLIAWDTTSCVGGRVLPQNKFDVMVFSLQKCFGAGGGTSVIILSPRAVQRLEETQKYRSVPYILDLKQAARLAQEKVQTINTPCNTNLYMLHEACRWINQHGGLTAMEKLCKTHADYLLRWAEKTDYLKPLIEEEKYRSFTTLTLQITDPSLHDADISAALQATGLPNLADGVKKYKSISQNSFRIACFPFVDVNGTIQYQKLTNTIDEIVRQLRTR
jgi:phosphoserine aminotransferase